MTTEKKIDVVAVGDAIIDTLVRANDDFLEKLHLQKNTVTLMAQEKATELFNYLDSIDVNEESLLDEIKDMSGGSAANTAAGLASFGAKVSYIGRVFADKEGKRFFSKLEERGIECLTTPAVDGERTGRSLVITTPDSSRTMCTMIGSRTHPEDMDEAAIASAKMVFFPAFMLDTQQGKEAVFKLIELAMKHQTKIAFSLSDAACVARHRNTILEISAMYADIVFANRSEAKALIGVEKEELAIKSFQALAEKRPFITVITSGNKGAYVITDSEVLSVPACKVEHAVDKTGVGALFASGFLYAHLTGKTLEESAKIGNMAAAEGLKTFGARPMIDLSTLLTTA